SLWMNTTHAWFSRYPSAFKVWAISQVPSGTDGTVTTSDNARGFPSFLVRSGAPTCTVPKIKGKTLKKAKKKLRKRSCKLGKVKGHGTNVKKQKPKPGTLLPAGSKVKVTLL